MEMKLDRKLSSFSYLLNDSYIRAFLVVMQFSDMQQSEPTLDKTIFAYATTAATTRPLPLCAAGKIALGFQLFICLTPSYQKRNANI